MGQAAPVASTLTASVVFVLVRAAGLEVPNARRGDEAAALGRDVQTDCSSGCDSSWSWTGRKWRQCHRMWRTMAVLAMAGASM